MLHSRCEKAEGEHASRPGELHFQRSLLVLEMGTCSTFSWGSSPKLVQKFSAEETTNKHPADGRKHKENISEKVLGLKFPRMLFI